MAFLGAEQSQPQPEAATPAAREAELPGDLERLYAEHFDFVWRSLRRLGVKPEDLDDAAQDVFIVLMRRRAEFRGQSSYRTWLFGIANNVSHEVRRRRQRSDHAAPLSESKHAPGPSPFEQASSSEELRIVDDFLASLDEDKRHVFILAELEQMSAPEIAQALGVKLNTVYSRLRAARQAFQALIEERRVRTP